MTVRSIAFHVYAGICYIMGRATEVHTVSCKTNPVGKLQRQAGLWFNRVDNEVE